VATVGCPDRHGWEEKEQDWIRLGRWAHATVRWSEGRRDNILEMKSEILTRLLEYNLI
jgi:hypothetical protein